MANDLTPHQQPSFLSELLEKLNLPELVAGTAGKAISRLIAGAVEIPAAYLDSFAQSIKSKSEAKQIVSKEVAAAAAKLAANDTDIVARAAHNLLAKELRHQRNKEEIARKTIDLLKEDQSSATDAQSEERPSEVDEDWLNVFERFAEDASSEKMQTLWARVLAGEIRKPMSFSLKALRFIAELDQETAQRFEKYVPFILAGVIPMKEHSGLMFTDMLYLQNSDLVTGVGGLLNQSITLNSNGKAVVPYQNRYFSLDGEPNKKIQFSCVALTKVGLEISTVVKAPFSIAAAKQVADVIPKEGLKAIDLMDGTVTAQGLILTPAGKLWREVKTTISPS